MVELEGRSPLNKFCIDGLLETQKESCEACEDKVQYLIQCRLGIEGGEKLTDVIVQVSECRKTIIHVQLNVELLNSDIRNLY